MQLVKACCALHNFLCADDGTYNPAGYGDSIQHEGDIRPGAWRAENAGGGLMDARIAGRNHTRAATMARNVFVDYFSCEAGTVDWQDNLINRR